MQLTHIFVVVALASVSINAAAISLEKRNSLSSPLSALEESPFLRRSAVYARQATKDSIGAQAVTAQQKASSELQSETASLKSIDPNSVTIDQLKPIIAQITSTMTTAGTSFSSLSSQAKALSASSASKRQGPDFNTAIDQLVVDLNNVLEELTPLVKHLTANLELGTVQDLVIALTPALTSIILGVEGLLTSLAPGLSTILDPLLVTVYGLTDALGINLNLPAP